jgi:tetratricopeptide (TPR) repeat protein
MNARCWFVAWSFLTGLSWAQDLQAEAKKLIETGRYSEALKQLEKLPVLRPPRPEVSRLWAIAWSGTGDWEQVIAYGAPYLQTTPTDGAIQVKVGEALFNLGRAPEQRADKAQAYAEQALECAEAALRVKSDDWAALGLKVRTLVFLGKTPEAVALAKPLPEQAPGHPPAWKLLAFAHEAAGAVGDAVAVLREAERSASGEGWPLLERGLVHERAKQRDEAIRAFSDALKAPRLAEEDRRAAAERIWSLCAIHKDWPAATKMVDGWIEAHPPSALAWWWRGYLEELQGNLDVAEGTFQRAWELSQQSLGEAALHLGHAALRHKDEKKALAFFSEALRLKAPVRQGTQSPADAIIGISQIRVEGGKPKEAAEILERHGAQHAADHPILQQNLGFLLRELGSAEAGKKNLTKARDLWKKSARCYELASEAVLVSEHPDITKAQILNDTGLLFRYHLDQIDKGITYYRRALEFDPNYLDALENMGVAMLMRKEWAEAISWFDKVLAIAPHRKVSEQGKKHAEAGLSAEPKKAPGQ